MKLKCVPQFWGFALDDELLIYYYIILKDKNTTPFRYLSAPGRAGTSVVITRLIFPPLDGFSINFPPHSTVSLEFDRDSRQSNSGLEGFGSKM